MPLSAHPLSSIRNVFRLEAGHLCPAASLDVLDADPARALFSCRRWQSLREMRPNLWRLLSPLGTGASVPSPTTSYGPARCSGAREVR